MDSLLGRFRNLTVLLLVLFAQLVLLAYQVKSNQDIRLIRVWAVTAVTPLARLLEGVRSHTARFLESYFLLVDVREENRQLEAELGRLKRENQFLKAELQTAERAQALSIFQARTPSRTVAARIIGTGAAANSKVVFVDRGSTAGVQKGMAVITPDGVVGKVIGVYPTASQVLLITDPSFAAGVVSQKNRVQGTLKGRGQATCIVDYLQNEVRVDVGEWFYTSGDDRVFPRGLPVGKATAVVTGSTFKEVEVSPSGLMRGLDEVLLVLEGTHQPVPELQESTADTYMLPPPPSDQVTSQPAGEEARSVVLGTDADRLREHYKRIGEAQGHIYGEGLPGSRPPDFNLKPGDQGPTQSAPVTETPPRQGARVAELPEEVRPAESPGSAPANNRPAQPAKPSQDAGPEPPTKP